ncbi:DUF7522 family protein [Halorubellus salinus]|uniref:DUF7522 family protein n=1 Tax=Halorubellus salinus TaxID=755309 RepID=UPI001D078DAB|nr:hypothetical protein [Halorubellus salinus]
MSPDLLSDATETELVRTTRTVVGDGVRSVTYFTPDYVEQLYLRDDLEPDADVAGFADTERLGFRSQTDYDDSELGEYTFTIRVFDHGYLTRVIHDDHGVFVTTDPLTRDHFEELAAALHEELRALAD